ncbi:alpha/beta hydrolase, partial [Escherichia coli]|nr:alpha/beta hydrolase [Escherichia coli]
MAKNGVDTMKRWKKITIVMSAIIVILVAILFIGNNFEMNET